MEDVWSSLSDCGFSKYNVVREEFSSPHLLAFLFDSKSECLEVVRGLHGDDYQINEVLCDANLLFEWKENCQNQLLIFQREDRKRAKRFHLVEPPAVQASELYAEFLGMSAKLTSRVSKSTFRSVLKNPTHSKTDIELAAREVWLNELIGYLEEGDLPIMRIASATAEPMFVLKRAFGNRRMKTLRNRARSWRKVRSWLLSFRSYAFPRDTSDMLDYMLFLMQEGAPASRIQAVSASLAVLEDCGQVPLDVKISANNLWKQALKSCMMELERNMTEVKRAPPLSVASVVSLELFVVDLEKPEYLRALGWVILVCIWACFRIADLEGVDPKRLQMTSRGLRGVLTRTKTTGPGKNVREVPFYIARKISLTGVDWLKTGFDQWSGYGCMDRDYFVFTSNEGFSQPLYKYADCERVAGYVRMVLASLEVPIRSRYGGWKTKGASTLLVPAEGVMFWSGHSMRHFLPTVSAAINISKEQRDYVGRWHVNLHQSADYIHTSRQIVVQVQEKVNEALCEGKPGYDEAELMEEYRSFLATRVEEADPLVSLHLISKVGKDGPCLGGQWPVLDESAVLDPEQDHSRNAESADQTQSKTLDDNGGVEAPYFVSISRRTGFRRLHKTYCCGVMPWQCHLIEWIKEVKESTADAYCKACQKDCRWDVKEDSSSSSGSSSSTENVEEDWDLVQTAPLQEDAPIV